MTEKQDPTGLAWYADPDFVNARDHVIPPGGATAYEEAPPQGREATDVTSFVYGISPVQVSIRMHLLMASSHPSTGQATWSTRHMPNILYLLRPGDDWNAFRRTARMPSPKTDNQGQPRFEQWPSSGTTAEELLDFEVLPDRPRTLVAPRSLAALGSSYTLAGHNHADLHNRQTVDALLRSRTSRPRVSFSILSWWDAPSTEHKTNNAVLANLSAIQIQNNTTRGSTPGLIDPALGKAGGRVYRKKEGRKDDTPSETSSVAEGATGPSNKDAVGEENVGSGAEDDLADEEMITSDNEDGHPANRQRNEDKNPVIISDDEDGHATSRQRDANENSILISDDQDTHVPNPRPNSDDSRTLIFDNEHSHTTQTAVDEYQARFDNAVSHTSNTGIDEDLARFDPFGEAQNALPIDSRDFDSDGQYIKGEVEWQLEQAIRAREESRRDAERRARNRPYGYW